MPGRSYITWPQGGPNVPVISLFSFPGGVLPPGTIGTPYSVQLSAINGKPPYFWFLLSDSTGEVILTSGGLINFTPTGSFPAGTLVIQVRDSLNVPSTPTNFTLSIAPPVPTGLSANGLTTTVIDLNWNNVSDTQLKDYGIYRNGVNVAFTTNSGLVGFNDTGLSPGTIYNYNITSRNLSLAESALSATVQGQTQGNAGLITLIHGQAFTVNGTGFGTKAGQAAPQLYDTMIGTPGTVSSVWTPSIGGNSPLGQTPASANIQLQAAPYTAPSGSVFPATDPFSPNIYAGTHFNFTNPFNDVALSTEVTIPGTGTNYPIPVYMRWKIMYDPLSIIDPRSDNNRKRLYCSQTPVVSIGGNDNFIYTNQPAKNTQFFNSIRTISNANPAVVTIAAAQGTNPLSSGGKTVYFFGMPPGWTSLNTVSALAGTLGGSNNQWTVTLPGVDTTGLPAWPTATPGGNGFFPVTGITQGSPSTTPAVVSFTAQLATNPCAIGTVVTFENIVGMTQINKPATVGITNVIINVTAIGGTNPNYTVTIDTDTTGMTPFSGSGGSMFLGTAPNGLSAIEATTNIQSDGAFQPPGTPMWQSPDANGNGSQFFGTCVNPMHAANGWCLTEVEQSLQSATGFAGGKFYQYDGPVNGRTPSRIIPYVGKTENVVPGLTTRCLTYGAYFRDRNANNTDGIGGPAVGDVGGIGDVTVARIIIGNAPTYAACTKSEYAPALTWANGQVQGTFWQGNYAIGDMPWIYVITSNTADILSLTTTIQGIVTAALTFDFFISATGSDAAAGTTPATAWAVTSLKRSSSNQAKMVGKKIGLMAMTIDTAGVQSTSQPNSDGFQRYVVPSGTGTNSTYVASCNASGAYSRGASQFICSTSDSLKNGMFGFDQDATGHITFDGILFDGRQNMSGTSPLQLGTFTAGLYNGIVFQNCEFTGASPNLGVGQNEGNLYIQGCVNLLVKNCWFHGAHRPAQQDHTHGFEEFANQGTVLDHCTFTDNDSGAEGKNNVSGTVFQYCYFANNLLNATMGYDGGNTAAGLPGFTMHHCVIDTCGGSVTPPTGCVRVFDVGAPSDILPTLLYNLTVYDTRTAANNGVDLRASGTGAISQMYNCILGFFNSAGGTNGRGQIQFTSGQYSTVDYNNYALNSLSTAWSVSATNASTLAAWRTASGVDAHSFTGTPTIAGVGYVNGTITAAAGPNQFKLLGTSPSVGAGRVGGVSTGAAIDQGAWGFDPALGAPPSSIGCSFGPQG